MVARKVAVTQKIPMYEVYTDPYHPNLERRVKHDLKRRMGEILVDEFEKAETPTVVRMNWINYASTDYFTVGVGLQAELMASTVMQVVIPEIPEPEWSYLGKGIAEWQCGYCGQVNIIEEHLECRKCGAPRRLMR